MVWQNINLWCKNMESRPLQAPNRRSPLQLGKAPGKQRIENERLNQAPLQRCQQCNLSQEPWGSNELWHKRFLATVESKHILQYFQGKTWQPLAPVAPAPSLQDDQPWKYRLRCLRWALDTIHTHWYPLSKRQTYHNPMGRGPFAHNCGRSNTAPTLQP